MPSSERLRQAAALLRQRAEAATPGPWGWSGTMHDLLVDAPDGHTVANVMGCDDHPGRTENDAAYIALMHPGVALLLADLLDRLAITAYAHGFEPDEALALADALTTTTEDR